MGLFFVYILKASLCLAVFYLFYRALLGKETFHRFNRLALLSLLALSCLLPAIEVTVSEAPKMGQAFVSLEEMMLPVPEDEVILDESSAALSWKEAMLLVSLPVSCGRSLGWLPCSVPRIKNGWTVESPSSSIGSR